MIAAGHEILLNKDIQVKHLKRWTLRKMIEADVQDRALPWTQLIMRERDIPRDLNLRLSQRISGLLVYVLLFHLGLTTFFHNIVILPMLAALSLVVVSYWNSSDNAPPLRRIGRPAEVLSYFLLVAIAGAAIYLGLTRLVIPIGMLVFGVLAGRMLPNWGAAWRNGLFATLVLGLVASLLITVWSFEIWLWVPLLTIALFIFLLNYKFYAFFARKRGVMFALAVVPFHLLYYFYSVASFVLGVGLYAWNTKVDPIIKTARRLN